MLGYISFTVLPHSMRCELAKLAVKGAGHFRRKFFEEKMVSFLLQEILRFLCLKDKFGGPLLLKYVQSIGAKTPK